MFCELNKQNYTGVSNQVSSACLTEARSMPRQNFNFGHKTKWNDNLCTKYDTLCTIEFIVLILGKISWTEFTVQEYDVKYNTIWCMYKEKYARHSICNWTRV